MKTKIYILHSLTILLLLLWIPVALDKIVDFDTFEAGMDWHQHFWFNLFFLTVSIVAWWLDTALQRRFPKKKALFQAIRP